MPIDQSQRRGRSRSGAASYGRPTNRRAPQTRNRFHSRSGSGRPTRNKRVMPTFDPSQFINKNPVSVAPDVYEATHQFTDWPFAEQVQKNIAFNNLKTPSAIQDQIIPEIINGRDVIGLAQTGTGKTAAFLLPIIQKILDAPKQHALILTPTRELAIQIEDELRKFSRGLGLKSVTCVGGVPIRPQIQALKRHNHFIIGTPGRVLDLMERRHFDPTKVGTVVLDEADRMLDMGFIGDMRTILASAPTNRHTLFFSATMTDAAKKITNDFLHDPVTISVKKKDVTNSIAQDVVRFYADSKIDTLLTLLQKPEYKRVIVFGAMKRSVETLSKQLNQAGVKAEAIHGNKTHAQRQRALQNFKQGRATVLVATDVAARGIHVDDVTHVINYDLPNTFEDYVHRIGRTGRSDKHGQALTFVQQNAR